MRNIFIVNPAAGKGKGIDRLIDSIKAKGSELSLPVEVYVTQGVGDGERFAREQAEGNRQAAEKEKLRIIACGGDGTLNEVINGVMGYEQVEVGVMPIGTGNDFARNFPGAGDFLSIEAQLKGSAVKCDALKYWGMLDGRQQIRFCANMFNIGFDCNVVDMTAKLKKYPLIGGSFAYLLAVLAILIEKKGAKLKVELDGQVYEDGPVLLTAIANGSYCGGGVKSAPYASVQDGLMDVNIIYNVSRLEFLSKFPSYAKGTHMELKGIEKVIFAKTCKTARITPLDGVMRLCIDGEIVDAGQVDFQVEANAFNVVVPAANV